MLGTQAKGLVLARQRDAKLTTGADAASGLAVPTPVPTSVPTVVPTSAPSAPPAPRTRTAPLLAIAGAKGGVGKTTLAVNLALLFVRAGYRTLLVDFDPGCGNVGVHLRLAGKWDLEDLAAGRCAAKDAIVDGPAGLKVVLGRSGSTGLAAGAEGAFARALGAVEELASGFDLVVCDTGAGIGPVTMAVAERADVVLGVTTPDVASITDAYALCKVLQARGRKMPQVVVNRVRSRDEAMRAAGKLGAVAKKFLGVDVRMAGWVSQDVGVERGVVEQRPVVIGGGGAKGGGAGAGAEDLRGLAAAVLAGVGAPR